MFKELILESGEELYFDTPKNDFDNSDDFSLSTNDFTSFSQLCNDLKKGFLEKDMNIIFLKLEDYKKFVLQYPLEIPVFHDVYPLQEISSLIFFPESFQFLDLIYFILYNAMKFYKIDLFNLIYDNVHPKIEEIILQPDKHTNSLKFACQFLITSIRRSEELKATFFQSYDWSLIFLFSEKCYRIIPYFIAKLMFTICHYLDIKNELCSHFFHIFFMILIYYKNSLSEANEKHPEIIDQEIKKTILRCITGINDLLNSVKISQEEKLKIVNDPSFYPVVYDWVHPIIDIQIRGNLFELFEKILEIFRNYKEEHPQVQLENVPIKPLLEHALYLMSFYKMEKCNLNAQLSILLRQIVIIIPEIIPQFFENGILNILNAIIFQDTYKSKVFAGIFLCSLILNVEEKYLNDDILFNHNLWDSICELLDSDNNELLSKLFLMINQMLRYICERQEKMEIIDILNQTNFKTIVEEKISSEDEKLRSNALLLSLVFDDENYYNLFV